MSSSTAAKICAIYLGGTWLIIALIVLLRSEITPWLPIGWGLFQTVATGLVYILLKRPLVPPPQGPAKRGSPR